MNEEQAHEAAQKIIEHATAASMTVEQARRYALSLGLYLTPAIMAPPGDPLHGQVFRAFVYIDESMQLRKLGTRIAGLSNGTDPAIMDAEQEEQRLIAELMNNRGLAEARVNHPAHYNMGGPKEADGSAKYEAIKVIEDWGLGFALGNALKYILRAPYKNDSDGDLNKACWYLDRFTCGTEPMAPHPLRRFAPADVSAAWGLDLDLSAAVAAIFERTPIQAAHAISFIDTHRVFGKKK